MDDRRLGWYFVSGEFTNNGTITINGDVAFILEDGYDLTVMGSDYITAILVSETTSFTVYAQSTGESRGKLTAYVGNKRSGDNRGGAGISGAYNVSTGAITINGGISATNLTLDITGGEITANATTNSTIPGLGGTGCIINITGVTVRTVGGTKSDGIYGDVSISGANTSASARSESSSEFDFAAYSLSVSGGTTATMEKCGAGSSVLSIENCIIAGDGAKAHEGTYNVGGISPLM